MNLYVIALAAAIAAAGAWKVQDWRYGAQDAARMVAAREMKRKLEREGDAAAVGHEKDKRELRTKFVVVTERIDHVLQSDFYAAGQPACLDDAGLRELNAARAPAAAASEPAGTLPGPAARHWWHPRGKPQEPN